jgi:cell division protein ZapD
MQDVTIIFEQPLNEHIRACLRLEHLFAQALENMQGNSVWECRTALAAILEAVNITDRPDLKSKLTKALSQHAASLAQLEQKPGVDRNVLRGVLNELDALIDSLYRTQDKFGYNLRANTFLNTIRQHMANPGGAVAFSTPAFHLWLQQTAEQRNEALRSWFKEFAQIQTTVCLLLRLIRNSARPQRIIAQQGFYQQPLDPNLPCHLIRLEVPISERVYPEISVGRPRLSVRFFNLDIQGRATPAESDIECNLTCCLL